MTLGEKIQQLRKISGLSQEQLGDQLGVSRQAISKWELNESTPDLDKIIQLGRIFSISLDDLLADASQNNKQEQIETAEHSNMTIGEIAKMNLTSRQIITGLWSVVIGIILLALEFLFLPVYMMIHKSIVYGQGYYTDAMKYAHMQPMPVIFILTGLLIVFGLVLIIYGNIRKKQNQ